MESNLNPKTSFLAAICLSTLASVSAAQADWRPVGRLAAGTPLPRCVLYNSYRVTPQGMMQCSYQCGDRIVIRGGYNVCAQSVARPAPKGS